MVTEAATSQVAAPKQPPEGSKSISGVGGGRKHGTPTRLPVAADLFRLTGRLPRAAKCLWVSWKFALSPLVRRITRVLLAKFSARILNRDVE